MMPHAYPPCDKPECYLDGEHRHYGLVFTGHKRYLNNPTIVAGTITADEALVVAPTIGETMATAPPVPNRPDRPAPSVSVANTVTLAKDGQGKATMGEFRRFVEAAEGFDDETLIDMQVWDDQREGMHIKISVTE